jgi:CPA1 family monovalent cation:H+ antiporter
LLTLAGPYVAWIAAETIHVSAVLACVAGGLYLGQQLSTAVSPMSRLQARAVWDLVVFVLNAMIFVLLGEQICEIVEAVPAGSLGRLLMNGMLISLVAIVVRLIWVPVATYLPRAIDRELARRDPAPPFKPVFLVSWTSMRGIVSLAAALSLPIVLQDGTTPFPFRSEIILVTMTVIVMTLVVQGLTLEPIIRAFAISPEKTALDQERLARREALRRGAEALEDIAREPGVDPQDVESLRHEMIERSRAYQHHGGDTHGRRKLRARMIREERRMLVRLRNEGAISDEVLRELEHELDLEAIRAGAGDTR